MSAEFGAWFDLECLLMNYHNGSYTRDEYEEVLATFDAAKISAYLKIANDEMLRRGRWHHWRTRRRDIYRNDEHIGLKQKEPL